MGPKSGLFLGNKEKPSRILQNNVDIFEKVRIISSCMDTKKDSKIAKCGDLTVLQLREHVVGVKQLKKALLAGRAQCVFLAENADPRLTEPLEEMCLEANVPCTWVPSMADLGSACGIEVGAAAAAVVG